MTRDEELYLADLRQEMWAEHHWEDWWCRTYGVGLYASTAEWLRVMIRRDWPHYRG